MTHPCVQRLSAAPGSLNEIRSELQRVHGLKIPGSSYEVLWRSLVRVFGEKGAPIVVDDLVKLRELGKVSGRMLGRRGPLLDAMLTSERERAAKRGRPYLRQQSEATPQQPATRRKTRFDHSGIRLPPVKHFAGRPAETEGYAPLFVRSESGCAPLRGPSNWRERHLENYLERNWALLDFGLLSHPSLLRRQARLSETQEKVDLLASLGKLVIPIELKIKEARGSDLTQLQSYCQDLRNLGIPQESVLGFLIAPRFSPKVINVARGQADIALRWVDVPA